MKSSPVGLFGKEVEKKEGFKMPEWLIVALVEIALIVVTIASGIALEEYSETMYRVVKLVLITTCFLSLIGSILLIPTYLNEKSIRSRRSR